MADVVERIRAVNPQLNAIVVDLGDAAMAAAHAADEARAAGAPLGPLHGVPVTIKQNLDVEGQPTPNGLAALAGTIAPADSAVVANLRRAGAIFVGRTNVPELSMRFTTSNPIDGPTRNPWHPDASPGGSSGGAGAATVAGLRSDPPRQRHRGLAAGAGVVQRRDDDQAEPGQAARVQPDRHVGAGPPVDAHVVPGRAGPDRRRRAPGHPRHGRSRPPGPAGGCPCPSTDHRWSHRCGSR